MKKLGTPSGTAPGSANEYVGLSIVGTPPFPRSFVTTFLTVAAVLEAGAGPDFGWAVFAWLFAFPVGFGGVEEVVWVLVGVDEVVGVEAVVLEVVGVVGVGVVVVGVCAHTSETDSTGSVTGNGIEDTGVPAGTFTVNESLAPPATVTVTTQESASAVATGIAARAPHSDTVAISPVHSFRPITSDLSSRPPAVPQWLQRAASHRTSGQSTGWYAEMQR
jgi:hypothetical protein